MEKFDALDERGFKLGYKLKRGKTIPENIYFGIVTIVTVDPNNNILVTKRNPNKPSGNLWEITGGGIQAGESVLKAARRELGEETGIWVDEADFIYLDKESQWPFICNSFVVKLKKAYDIILDPKETIDYKWLSLSEFFEFAKNEEFVLNIGNRISMHKEEILKIINNN